MPDYKNISAQEAAEQFLKGGTFLDVRRDDEFQSGHIPGAFHIPVEDLKKRTGDVPAGRPLYVICRSGARSAAACRMLTDCGMKQIVNVEGGMLAWKGPLEK